MKAIKSNLIVGYDVIPKHVPSEEEIELQRDIQDILGTRPDETCVSPTTEKTGGEIKGTSLSQGTSSASQETSPFKVKSPYYLQHEMASGSCVHASWTIGSSMDPENLHLDDLQQCVSPPHH